MRTEIGAEIVIFGWRLPTRSRAGKPAPRGPGATVPGVEVSREGRSPFLDAGRGGADDPAACGDTGGREESAREETTSLFSRPPV